MLLVLPVVEAYLIVNINAIQIIAFDKTSHVIRSGERIGAGRGGRIGCTEKRNDDLDTGSMVLIFDSGALCVGKSSPLRGLGHRRQKNAWTVRRKYYFIDRSPSQKERKGTEIMLVQRHFLVYRTNKTL